MPKVRYSNKAVEDLSSIWKYTYSEWSESEADEYYSMLVSACNRLLGTSVVMNRCYDEISDDLYGVRSGHHIIFYKNIDDGDVFIVRTLHEKMDLKRHFLSRIE